MHLSELKPKHTTHSCTTSGAQPGVVGIALVCEGGLLHFSVRCSTGCLASFLSRALPCAFGARGSSGALCGCVLCLLLLVLGSGRGGAARCLEVRGPVLQPQVSGLGAGFVVEDREQRRRGCDGPAWWLGERPWPLMSGESAGYTAGPCGVLALSLDVHGAA